MNIPKIGWGRCKWCNGPMPFLPPVVGGSSTIMGICWECYDVYCTAGEFAELVVLVKESIDAYPR